MNQRDNGRLQSVEWPTIVVAIACWSGWVGLLVWHDRLPSIVVVACFALLGAWYMSLQHEAIHGHPTPSAMVNHVLAASPLSLWLPFALYSESHLTHHAVELTVPGIDPESFFVTQAQWGRASRFKRVILEANFTLFGRFILGPALGISATLSSEFRRMLHQPKRLTVWIPHIVAACAVMWLVVAAAGVPAWQYLFGFCYLGLGVTYVRSFAEHRVAEGNSNRSAIVHSGRFFGTLFLNNNLHYTHHAFPGAAWYRLPALTTDIGAAAIAEGGAGSYSGYIEICRRYALRPISSPVSSLGATVTSL